MEHQYKTAIFDVDGTILDTAEGVISSIRYAINEFGLAPLDDDELQTFIGPPVQSSFARFYDLDDTQVREISLVFRNHYKDVDLLRAKPYEGIYSLMERLQEKKIRIAIATYKREDYASTLLDYFRFSDYTDVICGSDMDGKFKKKDIIMNAIKRTEINLPSDAIMIGDSDNDAIGAMSLGVDFIGVTYGYGFVSKDEAAKYEAVGMAHSTEELFGLIIGEKK